MEWILFFSIMEWILCFFFVKEIFSLVIKEWICSSCHNWKQRMRQERRRSLEASRTSCVREVCYHHYYVILSLSFIRYKTRIEWCNIALPERTQCRWIFVVSSSRRLIVRRSSEVVKSCSYILEVASSRKNLPNLLVHRIYFCNPYFDFVIRLVLRHEPGSTYLWLRLTKTVPIFEKSSRRFVVIVTFPCVTLSLYYYTRTMSTMLLPEVSANKNLRMLSLFIRVYIWIWLCMACCEWTSHYALCKILIEVIRITSIKIIIFFVRRL